MDDKEFLVLILLGIHALESLAWLSEDRANFISWGGKRAKVGGEGLWFKNPLLGGFLCEVPSAASPDKKNLNLRHALERWALFQRVCRPLKGAAWGQMGLTAGALAVFVLRQDLYKVWGILAINVLLIHGILIALFWRAHRRLFPQNKKKAVIQTFLCFISPWQALRGCDLLAKDLFQSFHPFPIAKVLLPRKDFLSLCRQHLLQKRFPAKNSEADLALLKKEETLLVQWLTSLKIDLLALERPPSKTDPNSQSFCERCLIDYVRADGPCSECGRPLIRF